MADDPLTLGEIIGWFRSKQGALAGSSVALVNIVERTEYKPAVFANFDGVYTMGTIVGWVSGEFDFEAIPVSDRKDIFWRRADVSSVDALEGAYNDFLDALLDNAGSKKSSMTKAAA